MVKKALLGSVSDTDIRLLRIFRSVVDCGGLAAAELELNIGRSTVSRHVKDLEQRLGLVLCRRGRGGFALTPDGERVDAAARQLLAALDGFRAEVRDLGEDLQGQLAVGLFDKTATNPAARLHQALAVFRDQAPQVTLDLSVGSLSALETAVIDGRLHVAVVPQHRHSDALRYLPLFTETMCLYVGQGHPLFERPPATIDWAALREHDYAGLAFHSPNMEVSHRFGLRRAATATDQEAVALLVLSGRYLGFLPDHYARWFEQAGRLRRVGPPQAHYEVQFVAVSRVGPPVARLTGAFLDTLARVHHAP